MVIGFAFFAYVLNKTNEIYHGSDNTLKGAMGVIVLMVILELVLWVGLSSGWEFVWNFAMFLFLGVDILRGIGFTLAFIGLKKIDRSLNSPFYPIYGWAPLVFEALFWTTESPVDDIILDVEIWVVLVLLITLAVMQFINANKVAELSPQPKPVAPGYSPYQPYQQQTQGPVYQTQKPVQESQTELPMQDTKFCEHCGAKIAADAKFCTNCGSST